MKAETKMSSQRKTNPVQYRLYVEPKKYSKLVNVVKRSRFTDTENRLVAMGVGEGRYRSREWEAEATGCDTGLKRYCKTLGI